MTHKTNLSAPLPWSVEITTFRPPGCFCGAQLPVDCLSLDRTRWKDTAAGCDTKKARVSATGDQQYVLVFDNDASRNGVGFDTRALCFSILSIAKNSSAPDSAAFALSSRLSLEPQFLMEKSGISVGGPVAVASQSVSGGCSQRDVNTGGNSLLRTLPP